MGPARYEEIRDADTTVDYYLGIGVPIAILGSCAFLTTLKRRET